MVGTFELLPPGKVVPRLRVRPGVRFGTPLDFSRYYGLESDRIVLRAITDEIMYAIMKLSGQEYVDTYAQRSKIRRPAVGRAHDRDHGHGDDDGEDPEPVGDLGRGSGPDAGLVLEVLEPAADLGPGSEPMVQADHGPGDRADEPDEIAASD
jgi:hypothetical protein